MFPTLPRPDKRLITCAGDGLLVAETNTGYTYPPCPGCHRCERKSLAPATAAAAEAAFAQIGADLYTPDEEF